MLLHKMDKRREYMFLQYYFTLITISDCVSLLLEHYVRVHEAD